MANKNTHVTKFNVDDKVWVLKVTANLYRTRYVTIFGPLAIDKIELTRNEEGDIVYSYILANNTPRNTGYAAEDLYESLDYAQIAATKEVARLDSLPFAPTKKPLPGKALLHVSQEYDEDDEEDLDS